MKIAYNPKTSAAITEIPENNDITFDLSGLNIYTRGVKFKGTDTTYSVFKKATTSGGYNGLVPAPDYNNGSKNRLLKEDGTWTDDYVTLTTVLYITGKKTISSLMNITNGDVNDDNSLFVRPIIYMDSSKNMIYSDTKANTIVRGSSIKFQLSNGNDALLINTSSVKSSLPIVSTLSITGTTLVSTTTTAAPLTVSSNILVSKLNADLLDGYHASSFAMSEHTHNYLPLSGGTMTGQIQKAGKGSSWISGRTNAFLRVTTINGYSPFASIKTTNGSWEIGAYDNSSFHDNLIFSYCTDANFNNGTNTPSAQIRFHNDGNIGASGFKKGRSSDNYVLLGGGGHKLISDLATSSHSHNVVINGTTKTIPSTGSVDLGSYLQSVLVSAVLDNITWALTASDTYKRAFIYNTAGTEYSYLFGIRSNAKNGAILKMGYDDKYLRILRVMGGNWQSTDWEKIYAGYADTAEYATRLGGDAIAGWGTLTTANGYSGIAAYDWGTRGAFCWAGKGGKMSMLVDGYFYQNEGKYRTLDTSDLSTLFTDFNGGGISSSGNTLSQANHSITIGGQTKTAGLSSCNIINSLSVSKLTSTPSVNLTAAITVNGVTSADKTLAFLWASAMEGLVVYDPAKAVDDIDKRSLRWFVNVSLDLGYAGNNYGFPAKSNANGILYLGTHNAVDNTYHAGQLGVSSNGRLYYRHSHGLAWSTTANGGSWNTIAWVSDIAKNIIVNQHTSNNVEYPLIWSNLNNSNSVLGNLLYKSYLHLTYNPLRLTITVNHYKGDSASLRNTSMRHIDAGLNALANNHLLYIGWGALTWTDMIRFYYSTGTSETDTVTGRTEFFRINSNGSYALTRLGVNGLNTSYTLYAYGNQHMFKNNGCVNLYLKADTDVVDLYSIIRFGINGNDNASYIFQNGPKRTSDGGANTMTIRNNVGNLRLNNNTINTGSLNVGSGDVARETLDVRGNISADGWLRANRNGSLTTGGITLYGTSSNVGIMFRGTSDLGTHGFVTSDWATYFTMNDNVNRGWIFRRGDTNITSISGTGIGYFNDYISADRFIARRTTSSHIEGLNGSGVALNMSCGAGYNMLLRSKSSNGAFNLGVYYRSMDIYYGTDTTINAGTNTYAYAVSLLNQNGVSYFNKMYINGGNHCNDNTSRPNEQLIVSGTGTSFAPIRVDNTSTGNYVWSIDSTAANITTNLHSIILTGKANTKNNKAYFGFKWVGDGNTSNRIVLGLYDNNDILTIDGNRYVYTASYLNLGGGNEKNASNPPYVWGVNGSDNYLRTYATSSLSVGSASKLTTARTIWGASFDGSGNIANVSLTLFRPSKSTGGWARDVNVLNSSGSVLAGYGFLGGGDTLTCAYVGLYNSRWVEFTSTYTNINGYLTVTGMINSNYGSGTWISGTTKAILNCTYTGYGAIFNAPTKNGRISMSTFPGNTDNIYIGYASSTQISNGTNAFNSLTYWNAATGSWYATHYYESSDKKLKTNILDIVDYDNIPRIRQFTWKSSGTKSYGFIAQELEELGYDELVSNEGDYKTVNYTAALALVIAKLKIKLDKLEKEMKMLKNGKCKNSN